MIQCGTTNYVAFHWGHAGCIEISNFSQVFLSSISNCSPNPNFLGYVLFSIKFGNQKINNLNSPNIFAKNIWSGFVLSDSISSIFSFNNCYNFTGYDCVMYRFSNTLGICEKNNFIFNSVSYGSITIHSITISINFCYFYSNLRDLNIYEVGLINLYGCVTNKPIFEGYTTDFDCKILQLIYSPFELHLYSCNFNDFTSNYVFLPLLNLLIHFNLFIILN